MKTEVVNKLLSLLAKDDPELFIKRAIVLLSDVIGVVDMMADGIIVDVSVNDNSGLLEYLNEKNDNRILGIKKVRLNINNQYIDFIVKEKRFAEENDNNPNYYRTKAYKDEQYSKEVAIENSIAVYQLEDIENFVSFVRI